MYILPTIRINNGQYRGKLSYTEVLRALCAGFTKNAEPAACMRVAIDDSCRDGSVGASTCATRSALPLLRRLPSIRCAALCCYWACQDAPRRRCKL